MAFRIFYLVTLLTFIFSFQVSAESIEKAAFVRDHKLWIKEGKNEIQITKDLYVYNPQWSYDGRFLGFMLAEEDGSNSHLFIYDTTEQMTHQPYLTDVSSFSWSPNSHQIAFKFGSVLNVSNSKSGLPKGFQNVSLGVSSYEWYPNGNEFIVSSESYVLPTGWEPVRIYKIPVDAKLDETKITLLYSLPKMTDDFFAVSAGPFKWSADGKWTSFIATPTPSWAMDSNTLCVLSSDGSKFQMVGKMLGFYDWFKWAPSKNQLAFISGEGRFFVENKNATVADIAMKDKLRNFTPSGFVDLDIEWLSEDEVIVARAKENKEWNEGPMPTMYTALYIINIKTGEQKQLTFPKVNEIDNSTQVIGSTITWTRKNEKQDQLDVWIKSNPTCPEQLWLEDVDMAPVFWGGISG
ncbi:translocation protein TolB [Ureibacillus sp. MALMAid1270]|uniref:TolB family protein n=1 Tax=Ureibacillus sp. MALMAid1270 TaxID=3411629 RepID=UPI003BA5FDE9